MSGKSVLITGAGFVGNAVAAAFRRKGYSVYVIVRSADKAKKLEVNEIHPVIGDVLKLDTYYDVFQKVDVVVNTAAGGVDVALEQGSCDLIFQAAKKSNDAGRPHKRVIFASGGLVYESNKHGLVTEESPTGTKGFAFMETRLKVEQTVIHNKDAITTLLRQAFIVGGEAGHHTNTFEQAEKGKVVIPGDGSNVLALAHIEDIASSFVAVAEADAHLVAGQIFNVSSNTAPAIGEVVKAFAAAAGYHGPFEPGRFPLPLYDAYVGLDNSKIRKVLGWTPSRPDILQEAPVLYKAWKAGGYPAKF